MDQELARHIVRVTFRSWGLLTDLIPLIKKHCDTEEYQELSKSIATISGDYSSLLLDKVFAANPGLEKEVEEKIKKFGTVI